MKLWGEKFGGLKESDYFCPCVAVAACNMMWHNVEAFRYYLVLEICKISSIEVIEWLASALVVLYVPSPLGEGSYIHCKRGAIVLSLIDGHCRASKTMMCDSSSLFSLKPRLLPRCCSMPWIIYILKIIQTWNDGCACWLSWSVLGPALSDK